MDIKAKYNEFKLPLLVCVFLGGPAMAVVAALPYIDTGLPGFAKIFSWLFFFVYVVQMLCMGFLFHEGWYRWYAFVLVTFALGVGCMGAVCFITFGGIRSIEGFKLTLLSWATSIPVTWWWGSRIFLSKGEIKEAVLRSKRIDLDDATYSPYKIPPDIYKSNWARRWLAFDSLFAGLAIGIAVYLAYLAGERSSGSESMYGAFWGYILVPISFLLVSSCFHEAAWMYRWEKKNGRKIYVKRIIDWKRLKSGQSSP
jgi:hypothetical protein